MIDVEIRHAHFYCGLGGGARGFNRGRAETRGLRARFRCVGGVDVSAAAIRDFDRLAGVPGTVLDLFSREQYAAFHGKEPPAGWREASVADIHRAFNGERPHILFLSAPCKGFSGLLSEQRSRSEKYQALNQLAVRGLFLAMETWRDDPPEFVLFENVPRIASRGRYLLDQITQLLRAYGYAVAETTHDCGELGNLAQSRKRFLLVARHQEKMPPFLYEPVKRPLRGVGEVLGRLPLPGDPAAGPMHRVPALQWKTWVRLAFVEAGSDWRSLNRLRVEDGRLADYLIVPEFHNGVLGVTPWGSPAGTVTGEALPFNGKFAVADPRIDGHWKSVQHGVLDWQQPSGVVTTKMVAGGGAHSVADPRIAGRTPFNHVYRVVEWRAASPAVTGANGGTASAVADPRFAWENAHENKMRVTDWREPSRSVTGSDRVGSGALSVADPRPENWPGGKYRVTGFDEPAGAVIAASTTGNGAFAVADPRPACIKGKGDKYETGGHYGIVPWEQPAYSVTGSAGADNGFHSVADPRIEKPGSGLGARAENQAAAWLPAAADCLVAVIRAIDGTWHRPFTTLDLAALQGLVDPEEHLELEGLSDSAWRERIGNAVPSPAAEAIAGVVGRALLAAWSGETFALSAEPIWVRPIAIAVAVRPV
jgi:site-specific DNA-cytosine methylase